MDELIAFAKWVINQELGIGGKSLLTVKEKAYELGLLNKETYDPEKHFLFQYNKTLVPGQEIYLYSEKLAQEDKQQ